MKNVKLKFRNDMHFEKHCLKQKKIMGVMKTGGLGWRSQFKTVLKECNGAVSYPCGLK